MGYRDEFVRRLKSEGCWDKLQGEQQSFFLGLEDEKARKFLVFQDQWDMGEPEAVNSMALASLYTLLSRFGMNLAEMDNAGKPRLSKAGTLLAEFITELQERQMDLETIAGEFANVSYFEIVSLIMLHKRLRPSP